MAALLSMETTISIPEEDFFFSILAIVGVALGVNVMIVVIAFMQGFQEKFKSDIIDSQGHARMVPITPKGRSMNLMDSLKGKDQILE